jgi:hypothetical protein
MRVEAKTAINHDTQSNGVAVDDHCCGCWHVVLDEDDPLHPYAKCNECGEIRMATFPGISVAPGAGWVRKA